MKHIRDMKMKGNQETNKPKKTIITTKNKSINRIK